MGPWREKLPITTPLQFPADLARRRKDRNVDEANIHPATLYRRLNKLMEEAGITGDRACGQTLRNTYAAMLIERGATDAELTECLGLFLDISAFRLRQAHAAWKKSAKDKQANGQHNLA